MSYPHLIAATALALAAAGAHAQASPASTPPLVPEPPGIAAAPAAPVEAAPRQAGFLKTLKGGVQLLQAPGEATRAAQAGDALLPGGRITTGPDSAASLVLRDGSTLVLGPSSQMELKAFSFDATTHEGNLLASLLKGSLRMITGLLGKSHPEAVRIETQFAFVGVRGTDFIVQADEQP
ncbi:FecR domain-containing protein [Polaromonas sp. CT11-55]|uniref:FecR family protein n=1 Tax=Polaromonas sp. CT11-55 TaxID=3243045 RepID=UPI0039A6301F